MLKTYRGSAPNDPSSPREPVRSCLAAPPSWQCLLVPWSSVDGQALQRMSTGWVNL